MNMCFERLTHKDLCLGVAVKVPYVSAILSPEAVLLPVQHLGWQWKMVHIWQDLSSASCYGHLRSE